MIEERMPRVFASIRTEVTARQWRNPRHKGGSCSQHGQEARG
jgi:hypothetical protein